MKDEAKPNDFVFGYNEPDWTDAAVRLQMYPGVTLLRDEEGGNTAFEFDLVEMLEDVARRHGPEEAQSIAQKAIMRASFGASLQPGLLQ